MEQSGVLVVDSRRATPAVSAALVMELETLGALVTPSDGHLTAVFPTVDAAMSAALHLANAQGAHVAVDAAGGGPSTTAALLAQTARHGQVLATAGACATVGSSSRFELLSLGTHRLRDLFTRCEVFEVVAAGSTAAAGPPWSMDSVPNNLPGQLDRFIGRDGELVALDRLLRSGRRLVTLTGPGGMGKSRLAVHAAAQGLDGFPDGVWLIELAPLRRGDAIDHAMFSTLGVELHGAAPMRDQLCAALNRSRALLVLDNCEHLVTSVRAFVGDVLVRCPNVTVVATSRAALRAPGEQLWLVGSLDAEDAAMELLVDRAMAAGVAGEAVTADAAELAEVCRRLDGMPLAIELAASFDRCRCTTSPSDSANRSSSCAPTRAKPRAAIRASRQCWRGAMTSFNPTSGRHSTG